MNATNEVDAVALQMCRSAGLADDTASALIWRIRGWVQHAAAARIEELESQLEVIGAGGVTQGQRLIEAGRQRRGEPVELQGVAEAISNGDGFWRSCTGCHEPNEGYDTGPYSKTLRCHLGNGCSECGGIGAVWDDTDYDAMGDYMARGMDAPQPAEPVVKESLTVDEPAGMPSDAELVTWATEEQFFLFCDEDEFLDIARSLLDRYGQK